MRRWRFRFVIGVLPFVFLATGCQATGQGFIQSVLVPTDKATFGFVFDGTTSTLSGSYHDPQGMTINGQVVSVDFKGTGVTRPCTDRDPVCAKAPKLGLHGGCVTGEPSYESQNPNFPGGGTFALLACDSDGQLGSTSPTLDDFVFILVETGPFALYANGGTPSGNITVSQ